MIIDDILKLIDLDADINKGDNSGCSPLFIACNYERIDIADILLDNGADINQIDEYYNCTSLYKACEDINNTEGIIILSKSNKYNMVSFLLKRGADVNIGKRISNGWTSTLYSPLYIACRYNNRKLIDILLKYNPKRIETFSEHTTDDTKEYVIRNTSSPLVKGVCPLEQPSQPQGGGGGGGSLFTS